MDKIKKICSDKTRQRIVIIMIATIILTVVLLAQDRNRGFVKDENGNSVILRNNYGQGDKSEEVVATVEDADQNQEELTIRIGERSYKKSEVQGVLMDAASELETLILGENKSLEEVHSNLNLITEIPESSISVSWQLSDYEVMNSQGELQPEHLSEGGKILELKALLIYEEQEALHIFSACVYPPYQTAEEKLRAALKSEVEKADVATKEQPMIVLPSEVDGASVLWNRPREQRGVMALALGIVLSGLCLALEKQNKDKEQRKKKKQMMMDYPEIINKFTVLLGAGMTAKNAWKKIVTDYEKRLQNTGKRYAYEEMLYTYHEMQGGMTENESYEKFGYRCQLRPYLKFGVLLSQNLRKGSKGLAEILSLEAATAFEERKSLAKKLGEEASTKLLLPMFLMLAIVLVIVIVPAFFSMQI